MRRPRGFPAAAAAALALLAPLAGPAAAGAAGAPIARQPISVNWRGNAWQGKATQGFVAPGIGEGDVTCRPPYDNGPANREPGGTQWVQLFPSDSTGARTQTVMWTTRSGGPPSDQGESVVRKAALLNPFYGPSFYEGMNTRSDRSVDPQSQGTFTGIVSARNKTTGPDVAPPTTFTLDWSWEFANLGEGNPAGNRCRVSGNLYTGWKGPERTTKRKARGGPRSAKAKAKAAPKRRRAPRAAVKSAPGRIYDFSVNWQGQESDPGPGATTSGVSIPGVGTLGVSCPWAFDAPDTSGSMSFAPAADNVTARGFAGYTTFQGAGAHAASGFHLDSTQASPIPIGYTEVPNDLGSYHLPPNGMVTGTLGVEPLGGGEATTASFVLSSEYVANDPAAANRFCHVSGQVIAR